MTKARLNYRKHSETEARKRCLQVTNANFERATSKALAPQLCETAEREATAKKENPEKLKVSRGSPDGFAKLRYRKITRPGLEELPGNTGESACSENGGTPGGTLQTDADLMAIVEAWPELSADERRELVRFVREAVAGQR